MYTVTNKSGITVARAGYVWEPGQTKVVSLSGRYHKLVKACVHLSVREATDEEIEAAHAGQVIVDSIASGASSVEEIAAKVKVAVDGNDQGPGVVGETLDGIQERLVAIADNIATSIATKEAAGSPASDAWSASVHGWMDEAGRAAQNVVDLAGTDEAWESVKETAQAIVDAIAETPDKPHDVGEFGRLVGELLDAIEAHDGDVEPAGGDEADLGNSGKTVADDLDGLSFQELRRRCKEHQPPLPANGTADELIARLRDAG